MFAHMDAVCFVKRAFHFLHVISSFGLEDFLQSSGPCIQCFFHGNFHAVFVCEFCIVCHFTDHGIRYRQFSDFVSRYFADDITKSRCKQISLVQIVFNLHTQLVTKCHLADCCCDTVTIQRVSGKYFAVQNILMQFFVLIHGCLIIRQIVAVFRQTDPNQFASCFFQFRCDNILFLCHIHCEGNQCRRNIDVIKGSGHTVFSSDRRKTKSHLCRICTEQCCKRLAPAFRIFGHTTEVFLECKADLCVISTICHDTCDGFHNCVNGTVIRAPAGYIWIKSVAHHGHSICFSVHYRNLSHHSLSFCQLIFTTIWHKYASCSDGSVKHLHQTFLGTGIQICQHRQPCCFCICRRFFFTLQNISLFIRNVYQNFCLLMRTVGIQESTGNINNFFFSPVQYQTRFFGNNGYHNSLQVFFVGVFHEFVNIFRIYNNCHTLLGLGDCDLGSVQTGVFFRYFIQIDLQTRCQFTDSYGYTAGTEVVTFLDQFTYFFSAEHTLDLTFGRRISFLYFGSAHFDGSFGMYFGRSGSTTDTVTASTSAKQDDDIARIGILSLDCTSWSSAHNRTDLHTFCHIIRMIDFFYITGSQTDLVTIGAVTVCSTTNQFLLRQFSFQCLFNRNGRICGTGHTHCLVYIGTS